uniref:Cysteine repeat modular protein 2 homologue, putative n=1 Tax=Theileria annulata TaxID=5874 RepID=A0A3B0N5S5_THEAN
MIKIVSVIVFILLYNNKYTEVDSKAIKFNTSNIDISEEDLEAYSVTRAAVENKLMKTREFKFKVKTWLKNDKRIFGLKSNTSGFGDFYYSRVQIWGNNYCNMKTNVVSNSARFKNEKGNLHFYCVENIYLDYSIVDHSCISNCGELVPCNGVVKSFTNREPINMKLVNSQIKKYCKISQIQESLDELCERENYSAIVDQNFNVKCYSSNGINYDQNGLCLEDCRKFVSCKRVAMNPVKGISINQAKIDWNALTNGCPCKEGYHDDYETADKYITYEGCQNMTIDNSLCLNWDEFLRKSHSLYDKRFVFPDNYCRELHGKKGIWCLTDMDKLSKCTPKEIPKISIQPGTLFDIWITPYIPKYRLRIIFIDNSNICGDLGITATENIVQSYELEVFNLTNDKELENEEIDIFEYSDSSFSEASYVFKGYLALEHIESSSKICACMYSSYYEYANGMKHPCSSSINYTITIGNLIVEGTSMGKIEDIEDNNISLINQFQQRHAVASLVNESDSLVCKRSKFLKREICMKSINKLLDIEKNSRTEKICVPEINRRSNLKYNVKSILRKEIGLNETIKFEVEKSGEYSLIYENTSDPDKTALIIHRYNIMGYYSNKIFTLITDMGSENKFREQSLFFESWKVNFPPTAVVISKYDKNSKLCKNPFAYSINIFPVSDSTIDMSLTTWRASDFEITKTLSLMESKVERFEVCVFTQDLEFQSLGFGIFTEFVNHELSEIYPESQLQIPQNIFNYKIYDKWDMMRLKTYINDDKTFKYESSSSNAKFERDYTGFIMEMMRSNYKGDFDNIDFDGFKLGNHLEYPAIMSFWSYTDEDLIRIWVFRPNRLSPTYIGKINVKSPLAFGTYISVNKLIGIVLTEGEPGIMMYEIEIDKNTSKHNVFNMNFIKSSCDESNNSCTKLLSPVDMKIITYSFDCTNKHSILVTDVGLNCIILYDSSLNEVSKICRDSGSVGIFEPTYISCSNPSNEVGPCINTLDGFKYESGGESSFIHCFITQPHEGNLLWVQVDVLHNKLTLLDSYTGGHMSDSISGGHRSMKRFITPLLMNPISVETLTYGKTILIYVVESENPAMSLLTLDLDKEIKKITYYGRTELNMISYGNFVHISKLEMSSETNDQMDDQDYVMLFRLGPRENYYNGAGSSSINIININDTISINNFEYNTPEWIVIGDELSFKPKIDSGNKQNLMRYELDILNDTDHNLPEQDSDIKNLKSIKRNYDWSGNPNHKNVIKINSNTGKITIKINYIYKLILSIRVTAFGFIESKSIYLNFKVACKDGYFFTENDINDPNNESNGCKMCQIGEFNSLAIIKSFILNWKKCTKCPGREITISEGSTSSTQCLCAPGYEYVSDGINNCEPCEAGKWKSSAGLQKCIGNGCYNNSFSNKIGSISEEDRECACYEGYYFKNIGGVKECVPCEEGYFCPGGIHGKKNKCPKNTTTVINLNSNGLFVKLPLSIDECMCKKGYEIVDENMLIDHYSPEYELKLRIQEEIKLLNVDTQNLDINKLICIPCGYRRYKYVEGNTKCTDCPEHTFSESMSPTSIRECHLCDKGYYETEDPQNPCEECSENHYCVGSDPINENVKMYSKKKIKCEEHSITIKPYNKNVSMLNCLCVEGFVPVTSSSSVKCIPAPKDHYKDVIGNVPAVPCPHGSLTMSNGATSKDACVCDKGTYFDIVSKHCAICPAGKYCLGGKDDKMNDRQPMECSDSNAQTKAPGASSSSECACKEGYYMDVDAQNTCKECPENHYKSYISNDMCSRCDENSSTTGKKGATSKEQCVCDPGYYFDRGCVSCNFNDKYCPGGVIEIKDDVGRSRVVTRSPIPCPPNTEIPPGVDNASSINFCKCTKGYYFVSEDLENNKKVCNACAPGTYKSSVMDSSCNGLCTQNATSFPGAESSNHCFCLMGYFYLEGGICSKCMEGAKCEGGLINYKMKSLKNFVVNIDDHVKPVAVEGYFLDKINPKLRKPDDWKFIKCPINGSCLGNDKCSDTMEHYLCSECKKGYTNNFVKGALCQKCPRMRPNISITILYYFGLLLINIVMARLNISSGYNRRSIHSVVIKIALNFGICTSVVNVVNFSDLKLPVGLRKMINKWVKVFDSDDAVYYTSIDCVIRSLFNLEHSDSFFYTMLYMACFPLILLFIVTLMMWIIMVLFKLIKYNDIRRKLALLQQFKAKYEGDNQDSLIEQYRNERLLMILRYIPLPNETSWDRFKNFLEDMIPIYVTVLFSVHGKITSRLLSLLDCTYIDLGRSFPGKYVLRPAMSIRCSINPSEGYLRYLILGLCGLLVWGLGIPFLSFMALFVNRNNLYAPSIRMKYGFLHNGFRQDYWYWETVVFARKCLVLVIGSIVIVPSENYSGSRIWMALVVAVTFLILQLIYKPFDERDYFVLGRLENHSMITWTFTLILVSFIIEANFTPSYNMSLLSFIVFINFLFLFELIFQLFVAYCHNFRIQNTSPKSFFTRFFYHFLTKISNKIKNAEPIIYFDPSTCTTNLRSSKKFINKSIFDNIDVISYNEKDYFSYVMNEIICFANIRMKLDVIPCDFPEYITRLTFAVYFNESSKQKMNNLVKSFADGNIDKLVNISMINDNYNNQHKNNKKTYIDENIVVDPYLMFDNELLSKGMPLSDFYVALSIIKLKDLRSIANTYVYFREYKNNEKIFNLGRESKKLNDLDEIAKKLNEPELCENIEELFCSEAELEELYKKIEEVEEKIRMFKKNPLNALKIYYSDEYSHIESGDFESDLIAFGFRKKSGDPRI